MGAPHSTLHREDQAEAAYLGRLGDRVRAWRATHSMTRKALALAVAALHVVRHGPGMNEPPASTAGGSILSG